MFPLPFFRWERDINPFFMALQPSCLSHLPRIQAGNKLGECSFCVPCHTSRLTPESSPGPGWLGPCQEVHRRGGFHPTLVPTSPGLRPHPQPPSSDSPPLLSQCQGSPHCLALLPQSWNKELPPSLPEADFSSHCHSKAFLDAPRPNYSQKHFPATLPTSYNLLTTQTRR